MTAILGDRVTLSQASGPDVELVVSGDEHYARYETASGHTVVYDDACGLYCHAALAADGAFVSTGVPASERPPPDSPPHLEERPEIRLAKAAASVARRSPPTRRGGNP